MSFAPPWTPEQEVVLKREWPKFTPIDRVVALVNEKGPTRDARGIRRHARVLKLRRPNGILRKHRQRLSRCINPHQEPTPSDLPQVCYPDGTTVTLCPPGHAFGAYRSDQLWGGWIYNGSRVRRGTT